MIKTGELKKGWGGQMELFWVMCKWCCQLGGEIIDKGLLEREGEI